MSLYAENETVWLDANRFYEAERRYYEGSVSDFKEHSNPGHSTTDGMTQLASSIANEIANVRQKIHGFLKAPSPELDCRSRLDKMESVMKKQQQDMDQITSQLKNALSEISVMKEMFSNLKIASKDTGKVNVKENESLQNGSTAPEDDDEIDLFGSDEETEDEKKLKEERLKAYADKKSKKPALVAKSSVVLDVKPWDDETDMKAMEQAVRKISTDGLTWGASNLVPLAYGIKKLQILAIVEDDKVSISWLQETIEEIEDLVQSVDIAAFNKL